MAGSPLLSIGTRAMFANYAALQTIGHNIANANVDGYSRQEVNFATAQGQFTGAGFFGKGVDVTSVTRAHNAFLAREAVVAASQAGADAVRFEQLQRLEAVFPPGETGLGYAASSLFNAAVDLASRPSDPSTRQVMLARANDLAQRFASAGTQIESLQAGVKQDLEVAVASINRLSAGIASVNEQIARVIGTGQPPNDLLDQRDQLVAELGSLVQVTTLAADDGTLGVFIAGGQRLVLGAQATKLALVDDEFDRTRAAIAIDEGAGPRTLPSQLLTAGGEVGGLLRFQNEDLAGARAALGRMAAALSTQINEQQALGLDLRTPPGAGAPLFSFGAPLALPSQNNARDVSGNFTGSVSMTIDDEAALQASEYSLVEDGTTPGNWLLTRQSDGLVRSIASGDTVDGLTITIAGAASGDRFLLQPVSRAAVDMRRVLDDPRGLAAASPLAAERASANTGSATVAGLRVASPTADPTQTATITFNGSTGGYDWELRDGSSNALLSSGSGAWTPGQPIALNGFELMLDGVPADGDVFTVGATQYPGADNGNALAFSALRDARFIGGETATDAYASLMAGVGVSVQGARTAAQVSASVATAARERVSAETGVNLDEEAARLIQFQQSYQAAAKVLQVAQSVFDTLLQTAGR